MAPDTGPDAAAPAAQNIRQRIEASRIPHGGFFGATLYPLRLVKVIYAWVLSLAGTKWGPAALVGVGLVNGSLIPIPGDPLLMALCLGNRRRTFHYAALLIATSVVGGVLGWVVGRYLFESVVVWVIQSLGWGASWFGAAGAEMTTAEIAALPRSGQAVFYPDGHFYKLREAFTENAFLVFVTSGFTPIPYNVAVISGGLFDVGLPVLVAGASIGRTLRFGTVATLVFFFGPKVKPLLERYFEWITLALLVLLAVAVIIISYAARV